MIHPYPEDVGIALTVDQNKSRITDVNESVICELLLRGSQNVSKDSLQLVYDGLKLYFKIIQKQKF